MQTLFPVWQRIECMPGEISYYLDIPEHGLHAIVSPLSVSEDRTPYAYTYAAISKGNDGKENRLKHWLDSGKKHKVSLQEGQRICEAALNEFIAHTQEGK